MNTYDYSIFWNEVIKELRKDEILSKEEYEMYFSNINYISSSKDTIKLAIPSRFLESQIRTRRYLAIIEEHLFELSGLKLKIEFIIEKKKISSLNKEIYIKDTDIKINKKIPTHPQLREDYTFDMFIVGKNNSYAAKAAQAIAENPGEKYNPYLIYGGVGLGKTHLMQSIGNKIYKDKPVLKVVYVTAESFINEFIESIKTANAKKNEFKNKYRNADVLLIDDIHDLQGKKTETQNELFHIFNALYDAKKQIVLTCDRPPSELKNFADRLKSRFVRGVVTDLQPPKFETRYAILKNKMRDKTVSISDDVIKLISENINTNVRDLEAALTNITAYAELVQKDITPEIAQQQLKQFFSIPLHTNITIDKIQKVVSEYFNISLSDMKGKKRTKQITLPRQIAMYIIREITDYSITEIGLEFGGRDHSTVIHSYNKVEDRIKSDPTMEPTIQGLIRSIKET